VNRRPPAGAEENQGQAMTYCVALRLNRGLVFAADTRTNAGVDNIAQFRKIHYWCERGDRVIVLLAAGNLSLTQSVVSVLNEQLLDADPEKPNLLNVQSMYRAARLVGDAVRSVRSFDGPALDLAKTSFAGSFILGGQIKTEPPRLFQIYPEGNFIEATDDTPYFQIGEHKYGKPILDRAVKYGIDIYDGLKIALLSMDSTLRSNLGVGMPIDITVVRRDVCDAELVYRIEPGDPYFHDLSERWSAALRAAHIAIPRPPYVTQR
jgi:putative proteasome-type protease